MPIAPIPAVDDEDVDFDSDGDRHRVRADSVRVAAHKVYDLLDTVGEAELDARRVEQAAVAVAAATVEHGRWLKALREATGLSMVVQVLAPGTVPRSEGKAVRVIDKRRPG